MKKTLRILLSAAIAVGFLASCSLPVTETGSFTLKLPGEWIASARGDAKSLAPGANRIRLYLTQNSTFIPLTATGQYSDFSFQDEIRIEQLRPGKGYRILVGFGNSASGTFRTSNYGYSSPFEISGGVNSTVTVNYWTSPFTYVTDASNASATVVGDSFDVLAGDRILFGSDFASEIPLGTLPGGYAVNSLSTGLAYDGNGGFVEELWLNTSLGIVPYRNGAFVTDFVAEKAAINVVKSGAYAMIPAGGNPVLAFFYSGGGKTVGGGGTGDFTMASKDWNWFDLEGLMKDPSFAAIGDLLKDVTSDLIASYALSAEYCILVTPLNTFRFGMDLFDTVKTKMDSGETIDATWIINNLLNNTEARTIISVESSGGTPLTISSVSTVDGIDGGVLFAGTQSGLYWAPIDKNGRPTGTFALASGTTGRKITTVVSIASEAGVLHAAALTADRSLLLLKSAAVVKDYPFYSGLPAGANALAWNIETDGTLSLAVTGSGGAAVIKGIQ